MEDYREVYILDTVEQLCTRTPEAGTVHKPECLKPDPIPAQRRDLAMQSRTYLQSYWWLWSSEKRRVSVLWECCPGKLNLIAVGGHTSQNICAAQIDFDGVKNRTELSRWGREIWEGMSEGWLQSKHIIQNSQINNKILQIILFPDISKHDEVWLYINSGHWAQTNLHSDELRKDIVSPTSQFFPDTDKSVI